MEQAERKQFGGSDQRGREHETACAEHQVFRPHHQADQSDSGGDD